jgi:hypothetical protein
MHLMNRYRNAPPQRLILDLLKLAAGAACCVCKKAATREGHLAIILTQGSAFCDAHDFRDVPRLESAQARYVDREEAHLIRAAEAWVAANPFEEKT